MRTRPGFARLLLRLPLVTTTLVVTWGSIHLATATEAVEIGQFTVYGPAWDGFDAAGIPCTYDRWRIGPFFVTRER